MSACLPDLHANDGVDEEEHGDEQADIRQSLEGLDEGPQEDPDGVALSQQFDETSCSEQLQETHVELIHRLAPGQKKGEGKLVLLVALFMRLLQYCTLSVSAGVRGLIIFLLPANQPQSL